MNQPTEPPDAVLLERLRPLALRDDPVPPEVLAAARAAHTWRRIDDELAELVEDSLTLAAGVRGTAGRLLTYSLGDLTVELEVSGEDGQVRVLGQLVPPVAARVRVEQTGRSVQVDADELGRFRAVGLHPGPTRLRLARLGPDGVPTGPWLATPWTVL